LIYPDMVAVMPRQSTWSLKLNEVCCPYVWQFFILGVRGWIYFYRV